MMQTFNLFTNKPDALLEGKADFVLATKELPKTPNGLSTLALISRAVHNLDAFSSVEILDLGLDVEAKEVFAKCMTFGKSYELKGNYLILGESILEGIRVATDIALVLENDVLEDKSNFEKLSLVSDRTLIFCAGFLLEASRRFHVVLAGGIQMAVCLLIADKLREDVLMRVKSDNITLATTVWATQDKSANIKQILEQLSYKPHAVYTTFSFAEAEIPILQKYDESEAQDGVGAGGCLAYAVTQGRTNKEVLDAIELIIYMM